MLLLIDLELILQFQMQLLVQTLGLIAVTLWDEGDTDTNAEILAEYEIEIYDSYSNYKITKKNYNEILTIKQTKDCDDYLEKIYEANTFEDAYVQEYNDEGTWWFI